MHRKTQRRPIGHRYEKVVKQQSTVENLNIQEAVTILGGIAGLIVAILWLAGRFYMAGYLGAMNIPAFQVSFSVWEYAEASWSRLIFYFLSRIYLPLVIIATVVLSSALVAYFLQRIFPKLRMIDALEAIVSQAVNFQRNFRGVLTFAFIIYFVYILLEVFIAINGSGAGEGRKAVLEESYTIEVYSKDSIPLGPSEPAPNVPSTFNHYSGFRLLTHNNGKYYLFQEIDPTTCKPLKVFVITDTQDIYFVLGDVARINTVCEKSPSS